MFAPHALVKIRRRTLANILTRKLLSASWQRSATSNLHCLSRNAGRCEAVVRYPQPLRKPRFVTRGVTKAGGCKVLKHTFITIILAALPTDIRDAIIDRHRSTNVWYSNKEINNADRIFYFTAMRFRASLNASLFLIVCVKMSWVYYLHLSSS